MPFPSKMPRSKDRHELDTPLRVPGSPGFPMSAFVHPFLRTHVRAGFEGESQHATG